ncbi:MAG: LptF/LptG family permease [Mailhella sp.]|nr:LptF/LptG family permease [Mailhella sp.]
MTLLFRYIFQRHARLLLIIMSLGLGLYLLTELVERVDIFIEADAGLLLIIKYFGARLPSIMAQILPAVFLLATVVVLCLMGHSRELTALHAGGISFTTIASVLVACGVFWGAVQFASSQFIGVQGARYADRVWQEQVRKRDLSRRVIKDVWFAENGWTVSVESLRADGYGSGLRAFHIVPGRSEIDVMVAAKSVQGSEAGWTASEAVCSYPGEFREEKTGTFSLPIRQDPAIFFSTSMVSLQQLPLWQLDDAIRQLGDAGSNVEGLRTVWHGKIAYAVSLVVMALLGAAIVSWSSNIYLAVGASMAGTFLMYAMTMFGESLGQRGILPPVMAAWGPDALLLAAACLRLYIVSIRR